MRSAVIVLSHRHFSSEYMNRLREGASVYLQKKANYIILSNESASEKNINFLKSLGIEEDDILLEITSKDTIGEAFLIKKNILLPHNITKVHVVSSDYHLDYRGRIIFDLMLGDKFETVYHPVVTKKKRNKKVILDQINSLKCFINTFEKAFSKTEEDVEQCFYSKHKLYKDLKKQN